MDHALVKAIGDKEGGDQGSKGHFSGEEKLAYSHPLLVSTTPYRIKWIKDRLREKEQKENLEPRKNPLEGYFLGDMGCGEGLMTLPLARLGALVYGLDLCKNSLEKAKAFQQAQEEALGPSAGKIEWILDDVSRWSFASKDSSKDSSSSFFDGLCAMDLLEHLPCPFQTLSHWAKFIKPGGFIVGSTLNRSFFSSFLTITVAEKILKWIPQGTHQGFLLIKPEELNLLLHQSGFTLTHLCPLLPEWESLVFNLFNHPPQLSWKLGPLETPPFSTFSPSFSWVAYMFFALRHK